MDKKEDIEQMDQVVYNKIKALIDKESDFFIKNGQQLKPKEKKYNSLKEMYAEPPVEDKPTYKYKIGKEAGPMKVPLAYFNNAIDAYDQWAGPVFGSTAYAIDGHPVSESAYKHLQTDPGKYEAFVDTCGCYWYSEKWAHYTPTWTGGWKAKPGDVPEYTYSWKWKFKSACKDHTPK